jgi:hypothetical protein
MLNQKDYARHNYNQQMVSSLDHYPDKSYAAVDTGKCKEETLARKVY